MFEHRKEKLALNPSALFFGIIAMAQFCRAFAGLPIVVGTEARRCSEINSDHLIDLVSRLQIFCSLVCNTRIKETIRFPESARKLC
jgi:hypothetical protein